MTTVTPWIEHKLRRMSSGRLPWDREDSRASIKRGASARPDRTDLLSRITYDLLLYSLTFLTLPDFGALMAVAHWFHNDSKAAMPRCQHFMWRKRWLLPTYVLETAQSACTRLQVIEVDSNFSLDWLPGLVHRNQHTLRLLRHNDHYPLTTDLLVALSECQQLQAFDWHNLETWSEAGVVKLLHATQRQLHTFVFSGRITTATMTALTSFGKGTVLLQM